MRLAAVVLAVLVLTLAVVATRADDPLPPVTDLEGNQFETEGRTFSIVKGAAYEFDRKASKWSFFQRVYDPEFFAKNYVVEGERVFVKSPDDGKRYEVTRHFTADFEGASRIADLIGEKTRWTGFTLKSPKAKTVSEYVKLRHRILAGTSDFLDNRVEPSGAEFHGGTKSLRTLSVAATSDKICAKASLQSEFLHFKKGDDFWYSAWYLAKGALPQTIMDLESTWIEGHAGIRIMLGGDGLMFELKWGTKPKWRPRTRVPFPTGTWVHVVAHVKLSETDGLVAIWQDGALVSEGKGQTLPFADTIYNSLEVGISATGVASEMFVDDVEVSDKPLR